jgi:hypothetical protein
MKHMALLVASLTLAHFADAHERGGYIGVSVGAFDYQEVDDELGLTIADSASMYRITGGFRFSDNFAVEGGWALTGDLAEVSSELVPGLGTVTVDVIAEFRFVTLRALWILPLEKISLLGGVGYYHAAIDGSGSLRETGSVVDIDKGGRGVTVGGGIQGDLERLSVRGELEWLDADSDVRAWSATIGVLFRL